MPAQQAWRLEMPYLRVPKRMPLAVLAKYLSMRLQAPNRAHIDLFCRNTLLQPGGTVPSAWFPSHAPAMRHLAPGPHI